MRHLRPRLLITLTLVVPMMVCFLAPQSASAATHGGIAVSFTPKLARPQSLRNRNLSSERTVYVFLRHVGALIGGRARSVASVRWYIDDPTMLKPPWMVERNRTRGPNPKFDLNGSLRDGALAAPFDLGSLADIRNTITAAVVSRTGKVRVVSASFVVHAAPGTTPYTDQVFGDDFDGTTLNQTNWSAFSGPGNLGIGLREPSAVSVGNSELVITAQNVGGQVVSGGLSANMPLLYGQYQFRVETQNDPSGITSGIVLLYPTSGIYAQGEEDMYETLEVRDPLYAFLHALVPKSTPTVQDFFVQKLNATRWVSETVDLTPTSFTMYRNGVLVFRDTNPQVIPTAPHEFNIQLDATQSGLLQGPVSMHVSYVHVYQ